MESAAALQEWLAGQGIVTAEWGQEQTKSAADLWVEVVGGESVLATDPPRRMVSVVQVEVWQDGRRVIEAEQEMEDGRFRPRHRPPSEKIKPGESVREAALRCLAEELGVERTAVAFLPHPLTTERHLSDSHSYPGLLTEYTLHTVQVAVSGLPPTPFWRDNRAAAQGDPVRRHRWEWEGGDGESGRTGEGERVLATERLLVRRATVDDVEMFYALWNNPQVMGNVGFPRGLGISREEIRAKIAAQGATPFDGRLVVILQASGERLGEAALHRPDAEGIAETDVKLLPQFWGHKYGAEVKRGLVEYLFTHTDCRAVQATPNVNNVASIRMQEAVGGVRVGETFFEFPDAMGDKTVPVRAYIYHVRREDWQGRH